MIAKGFSLRNLRSRRALTADPLPASQERWYPPSPFTAYREDLAISEQSGAGGDRISSKHDGFIARLEKVVWTAGRTRHRLSMEASVGQIAIFAVAVRVQRPELHRCVAAVIRKAEHN